MGKRRLLGVREREGESTHYSVKKIIEILKEKKGNIEDWIDDETAMKTRAKFAQTRWMPYQGVNKIEDLDLSDPQISLEWKLCESDVLKYLLEPGGRDRLFATLTEEEKDIYLHKTGTDGASYTDLETGKSGFTRKNIAKSIIKIRSKA